MGAMFERDRRKMGGGLHQRGAREDITNGEGRRRGKQHQRCLERHRKGIKSLLECELKDRGPHLTSFGRTSQASSMSIEAFCHGCALRFYPKQIVCKKMLFKSSVLDGEVAH